MQKCIIEYIPPHLHWLDKAVIPVFYNNEELYWRNVNDYNRSIPYATISLADISVNRCGGNNKLSQPIDVLWNTEREKAFQKYDCDIIVVLVKLLFDNDVPVRVFNFPETGTPLETVVMKLEHDPIPCNYVHSMFVFYYKDERVLLSNFEESFGRKNKSLKRLRQVCRDEIHKAIIKKEISFL